VKEFCIAKYHICVGISVGLDGKYKGAITKSDLV